MLDDEAISQIIDDLILEGGLEVVGVDDETGEILYVFTPKVKELMPDLYEQHLNFVNDELMVLWEKGYVNIDFFKEDPPISLTEKAFNDDEIKTLSLEERWSLNELKRAINPEEF